MSSIPIDHLGRDELVILWYRVANRLSTITGDPSYTGMPQAAPSDSMPGNIEPHYSCNWASITTHGYQIPLYEGEHDPWNAHLRGGRPTYPSYIQPQRQLQQLHGCPTLWCAGILRETYMQRHKVAAIRIMLRWLWRNWMVLHLQMKCAYPDAATLAIIAAVAVACGR